MGVVDKLRREIAIVERMVVLWQNGEPGAQTWLVSHLNALDKHRCRVKATIQYERDCCVLVLGRGEGGQWEYRTVTEEEAVFLEQTGWTRLAANERRVQTDGGGRPT